MSILTFKKSLKHDLIDIRQSAEYTSIKSTIRDTLRYIERLEKMIQNLNNKDIRQKGKLPTL